MVDKFNIVLHPETRNALEKLAEHNGESKASVVRRLVLREARAEGIAVEAGQKARTA